MDRSLMILFAVLGVVLAVHVWLFFRTAKEKKRGRRSSISGALAAIQLALDGVVIGFVTLFSLGYSPGWYMTILYVLAGLLTFALPLCLLLHWFNKRRFFLWLLCALLVWGTIGGVAWRSSYLRSITLREEFDYRTYLPFREGSLAQTLDEPATLRFSEDDALPRMDGATALYPVYAAFCQAVYPSSISDGSLSSLSSVIKCSQTAGAYKNIVEGKCDVIFVAGPSKEQEAYAEQKGVELIYTPIGREAFVFFVHPDNPIESLSLSELRGVYSGEITDWAQLGVNRLGAILAYQRDEGSGSQTALERFVMQDTPLMPAKTEEVVGSMGGIVEQVSSYQNRRNALGFSFRFYCTALMKGFDVKLLQIDGTAPTVENIENGRYPLASSFYAVTRSDADENTKALLAWICGAQGQALVEKTGYTPQNP